MSTDAEARAVTAAFDAHLGASYVEYEADLFVYLSPAGVDKVILDDEGMRQCAVTDSAGKPLSGDARGRAVDTAENSVWPSWRLCGATRSGPQTAWMELGLPRTPADPHEVEYAAIDLRTRLGGKPAETLVLRYELPVTVQVCDGRVRTVTMRSDRLGEPAEVTTSVDGAGVALSGEQAEAADKLAQAVEWPTWQRGW